MIPLGALILSIPAATVEAHNLRADAYQRATALEQRIADLEAALNELFIVHENGYCGEREQQAVKNAYRLIATKGLE